jgi:hypothetical protein
MAQPPIVPPIIPGAVPGAVPGAPVLLLIDRQITWNEMVGRIVDFQPYIYPLVGSVRSREELEPLQLFDERLMEDLLQNDTEAILRACKRTATVSLTLFKGVIFKNCITHIWDQVYVIYQFFRQSFEWKQKIVEGYNNLPGEDEVKRWEERLQETKEEYDEFYLNEEKEEQEEHKEHGQSLLRQIANLRKRINQHRINRAQLERELKETVNRNQQLDVIWNTLDPVILSLQVLDLWKGWMTLRHSYLELLMPEYIAMRYLPLSMLTWLFRDQGQYIRIGIEEDELQGLRDLERKGGPFEQKRERKGERKGERKEEKYPVAEPPREYPRAPESDFSQVKGPFYVTLMQNILNGSSYTWHPTGLRMKRQGRSFFMVYPIWNYGALSMYVCEKTHCIPL